MRSRPVLAWTSTLAAALALTAAAGLVAAAPAARAAVTPTAHCPRLSDELTWYGDNRAQLQRVIDERGTCHGKGGPRPVAAFDWDNTVTKNDVTDATISWSLRHDKILRPARWKDTSKWLTDTAEKALTEACGTDVEVGAPLPTSTNAPCADEILQIREDGTTMSGEAAFAGSGTTVAPSRSTRGCPSCSPGTPSPNCARTPRPPARRPSPRPSARPAPSAPTSCRLYVRYYEQQRDLIRTLRRAGFDVWIVSAGSEPVTEVWSRGVGIDRAHTVAIRSVLDDEGRITTRNEGCGGIGRTQGEAIPYIDGKRCWINQEIYGIKGRAAWNKQAPQRRIALGGGDADTDVTFVGDATGAHLVLNRNKNEVMCRAYDNADGRWVVNPMFIEPLPRRTTAYPCATAAWTRPGGGFGPVRRDDGSVVPDQQDTVY